MGTSAIKKLAMERLKCNLAKAISLFFLSLITCLCIQIVEQMLILLFDSFKIVNSGSSFLTIPLTKQLAQAIAIVISMFVIAPLVLSVKKWYIEMIDTDPPVSTALYTFYSPKIYFSAVWYSFVKNAALTIIFTILLVPIIILAGIFRSEIKERTSILAILLVVIFLAVLILLLAAAVFAVYIALGFFYADYIYLLGNEKNPFKIISKSFKMAKYHRKAIVGLILSMVPLALLCVFIVPAIFIIPYISSALACFAKQHIEQEEYIC